MELRIEQLDNRLNAQWTPERGVTKVGPEQQAGESVDQAVENFNGHERDPLSESLRFQLNVYMKALATVNERRETVRDDFGRERALLDFTYAHFIASRDRRIEEILSSEVQETIAQQDRTYPLGLPRLVVCIDGRIFSKIFAGLHGNTYRTPAGDSRQFVWSQTNKDHFLEDRSAIALMIDGALAKRSSASEVLDSHVGCAARLKGEKHRHGVKNDEQVPDAGLFRDVIRKKQMAAAMVSYVQEKYGDAKQILPMQTSYDVETGFLYMGLENDDCLTDDRVAQLVDVKRKIPQGFTKEILKELVSEGKILSTQQLLNEPLGNGYSLKELFESNGNDFDLDYEANYVTSTVTFWDHIETMKDTALPMIRRRIALIFPELSDPIRAPEVDQRAILLLSNAYTAFLLNKRNYPYELHRETFIDETESEKGPFGPVNAFSIDSSNPDRNAATEFSADFIRQNRLEGRMSIIEMKRMDQLYPDRSDLELAPVPVGKYSRLNKYSESVIRSLQVIDWTILIDTPWLTMSVKEFENFMQEQWDLPSQVEHAIERLRQRAIDLYSGTLREDLFAGNLAPLFVLATPKRRTIALLPFLLGGMQTPVRGHEVMEKDENPRVISQQVYHEDYLWPIDDLDA